MGQRLKPRLSICLAPARCVRFLAEVAIRDAVSSLAPRPAEAGHPSNPPQQTIPILRENVTPILVCPIPRAHLRPGTRAGEIARGSERWQQLKGSRCSVFGSSFCFTTGKIRSKCVLKDLRTHGAVRLWWEFKEPKGPKANRILSQLENSAFLHILSKEGRGVGLCWAHSQPKGPKKENRRPAKF